jgi:hypothetical protein
MGLCLVTRLKESVADSSLLRPGEKTFLLNADGEFMLRGIGVKLRVLDDSGSLNVTPLGGSATNETDFTIANATYNICKNLSGKDLLIGISEISKLDVFGTDKESKCMELDLNIFAAATNMSEIKLNHQLIVGGNLATLKNVTSGGESSLTTLSFYKAQGIAGSIDDIGGLRFSGNAIFTFFMCANVTGDIVNFVKKQRQIGRTSATCTDIYFVHGTGITFNGNSVADVIGSLSWTSSTITLGETTINA